MIYIFGAGWLEISKYPAEIEITLELRKEVCCERAKEEWKLFKETGDLMHLLLWYDYKRCCEEEY